MHDILKRVRVVLFAVILANAFGVVSAQAQVPGQAQVSGAEVRVATRLIPPMVAEQDGKLTGFSIELWEAIASRLGLTTRFVVEDNITNLLGSVQAKRADVGISAISITSERDEIFDFSQPMLGAGLQILVRSDHAPADRNALYEVLALLFSPSMLGWIGIGLLLSLIPAHIIWYFERQKPEGIIQDRNYIPGIFQAIWWSLTALIAQSERMPNLWIARLFAVFWMFTGLVFVAYYTAQLTATLTVQQIVGTIRGPDDLPGKRVATLRGSTAAAFAREAKIQPIEFDRIEEAYGALLDKKADAVVFDAPILQYFAAQSGKGRFVMAGGVFKKEDYGIAFPLGSPLRKRVDQALLKLREDGTFDRLLEKWFVTK